MTAETVDAAAAQGGAAAASPTSSPAIPDTTPEMPAKSARAQAWNELFNMAKLISTTEIVPKPLTGPAGRDLRCHGVRRGTRHLTAHRPAEH